MNDSGRGSLVAWSLRQGLQAARKNRVPALLLQAIALSIVLVYYIHEPSRPVFDAIAALKLRYGYLFSLVSTALFGALIPLIILRAQPATRQSNPWRYLPFLLLFWAEKGVEVDALYRVQAFFFGADLTLSTVLPKVFVDQFVYMPLINLPPLILLYLWRDCGYSVSRTRAALGPRWYRNRVVPVMISNWGVWIPAVTLIYCLPVPLQLPVENLILCLWVLLLSVLTNKES